MKLFLHFDEQGKILAAAKSQEVGLACNPFAHVEDTDHIVEMDLPHELQDLEAHEIYEQCQINLKTHKVKRMVAPEAAKTPAKHTRKPNREHRGR
jgi:hypothetical protein